MTLDALTMMYNNSLIGISMVTHITEFKLLEFLICVVSVMSVMIKKIWGTLNFSKKKKLGMKIFIIIFSIQFFIKRPQKKKQTNKQTNNIPTFTYSIMASIQIMVWDMAKGDFRDCIIFTIYKTKRSKQRVHEQCFFPFFSPQMCEVGGLVIIHKRMGQIWLLERRKM